MRKINKKIFIRLLDEENHYKIMDIYLMLTRISVEHKVEGKRKCILFSDQSSVYALAKTLHELVPSIKSLTTVKKTLNYLIDQHYLMYDPHLKGWILLGMEYAFKKGGDGYIDLKKICFSKAYYDLSFLEKKILLYSIYLNSNSKGHDVLNINLNDKNSKWYVFFKGKNIYYIKNKIKQVVDKFCHDLSDPLRKQALSLLNHPSLGYYIKKRKEAYLKFRLRLKEWVHDNIETNKKTSTEILQVFSEKDTALYGYLSKIEEIKGYKKGELLSDDLKLILFKHCVRLSLDAQQEIINSFINQLMNQRIIQAPAKYIKAMILNLK